MADNGGGEEAERDQGGGQNNADVEFLIELDVPRQALVRVGLGWNAGPARAGVPDRAEIEQRFQQRRARAILEADAGDAEDVQERRNRMRREADAEIEQRIQELRQIRARADEVRRAHAREGGDAREAQEVDVIDIADDDDDDQVDADVQRALRAHRFMPRRRREEGPPGDPRLQDRIRLRQAALNELLDEPPAGAEEPRRARFLEDPAIGMFRMRRIHGEPAAEGADAAMARQAEDLGRQAEHLAFAFRARRRAELIGGGGGGRLMMAGPTRITKEMTERAAALREEDIKNNPSPTVYSRACMICAIENPSQRAVYTACGHVVCYPCAVEYAGSQSETADKCPTCRTPTGFIRLFEDDKKQ